MIRHTQAGFREKSHLGLSAILVLARSSSSPASSKGVNLKKCFNEWPARVCFHSSLTCPALAIQEMKYLVQKTSSFTLFFVLLKVT